MSSQIAQFIALLILTLVLATPTLADWQSDLNANLAEQARLQGLINQTKGQESTLNNQISIFNNQILLTQLQINAKQNQLNTAQAQLDSLTGSITSVTTQITNAEQQLSGLSKIAVTRFRVSQAVQNASPLELSLLGGDFQTNFQNESYQKFIVYKDKQIFTQITQLKSDLSSQKINLVDQQSQIAKLRDSIQADYNSLAISQAQLARQKNAQVQLLLATKNSESNYQGLLAQAKAQQASLLAFANARVGSGGSILPHSSLSDGWGQYYNQRDSSWGNIYIGYSSYQIWQVGCLLTDVAMVYSHFGNNSYNPAIIGADASNFWGNTAALNYPGPVPPGHSESHYADPDLGFLRAQVSAGKVVVAGLSFNGGSEAGGYYPDHWVVVRGLDSGGGFMINDPWYQNAMNVPINYSHPDIRYADAMIIEARVYQ